MSTQKSKYWRGIAKPKTSSSVRRLLAVPGPVSKVPPDRRLKSFGQAECGAKNSVLSLSEDVTMEPGAS